MGRSVSVLGQLGVSPDICVGLVPELRSPNTASSRRPRQRRGRRSGGAEMLGAEPAVREAGCQWSILDPIEALASTVDTASGRLDTLEASHGGVGVRLRLTARS